MGSFLRRTRVTFLPFIVSPLVELCGGAEGKHRVHSVAGTDVPSSCSDLSWVQTGTVPGAVT